MENKNKTQRIDNLCDKIVNKIFNYRKILFADKIDYSRAEIRDKIHRLTHRFNQIYGLRNSDGNLTSLQKSFLDDLRLQQSIEHKVCYQDPTLETFEYEQYCALTGAFP